MHVLNIDRQPGESGLEPTHLFNSWRRHGQRVGNLARDVAQELGLSDGTAARVEKAALYHDIGKSRLPNFFDGFEDNPESLSGCQRELLISHTWLGYRILHKGADPDSWIADAALLHHERWDGNGYPLGLAGSAIPLAARIVAVADCYNMLIEQHPFASAWHVEHALAEVRTRAGTQFDPECVEALAAIAARNEPFVSRTNGSPGSIANPS